jgi:Zn finger protein HypA/HybF involved in hydrogenase expression
MFETWKMKCNKCNHNYKKLTQEGLCAECHLKKHLKWSKEFSEPEGVKK